MTQPMADREKKQVEVKVEENQNLPNLSFNLSLLFCWQLNLEVP